MIRLAYYIRRKPGTDRDAFRDYWRHTHGPLVASFATALDIQRYVQTHTLESSLNEAVQRARGAMEPPYDGVADFWWSSPEALEAALATPAGQAASAALLDDERRFIDLPNSPLFLCHDYPQVNPTPEDVIARERSDVLRFVFPLRQQPGMSDADARRYWLTQHGPLVRRGAAAAGLLCYRQVHRADHALDVALREARGTRTEPYLGMAESWVDLGRSAATPTARRANATFIEDEHNFIDMTRSTIFAGKEHLFIDRLGDW